MLLCDRIVEVLIVLIIWYWLTWRWFLLLLSCSLLLVGSWDSLRLSFLSNCSSRSSSWWFFCFLHFFLCCFLLVSLFSDWNDRFVYHLVISIDNFRNRRRLVYKLASVFIKWKVFHVWMRGSSILKHFIILILICLSFLCSLWSLYYFGLINWFRFSLLWRLRFFRRNNSLFRSLNQKLFKRLAIIWSRKFLFIFHNYIMNLFALPMNLWIFLIKFFIINNSSLFG